MNEIPKVLPRISPEAEPFWEGLRNDEVRLQQCNDCGQFQFYPRPICSNCWSTNIEWETVEGSGEVYSFSIPGFAPHPSFKDRLPYIVALVDLDVGVRMMTNIVECDPAEIRIGMRVEPVFAPLDSELKLLYFKPKNEDKSR